MDPLTSPRAALAGRLRALRQRARLHQAELGEQLGHTQSWVARVETCAAGIELHEAEAWAKTCGSTLSVVIAAGPHESLLPIAPELDEEGRALLRRAATALVLHPPARRRLRFEIEEWEAAVVDGEPESAPATATPRR